MLKELLHTCSTIAALGKTVFRFKTLNTILDFHFFCIIPTVSVSIGVIQSVHNAMQIGWQVFAWYGPVMEVDGFWLCFRVLLLLWMCQLLFYYYLLPHYYYFSCYNHSLLVTVVIKFVNSRPFHCFLKLFLRSLWLGISFRILAAISYGNFTEIRNVKNSIILKMYRDDAHRKKTKTKTGRKFQSKNF